MLLKDFRRRKRKGGKMDYKWSGPYVITQNLGKGLYTIRAMDATNAALSRVNGAHLKPYNSPMKV